MIKSWFKKCLFIILIVVLIMFVISIMIKYNVEGEKSLPFEISKMLLVSTVDGKVVDDPNNIWNINVEQVNDVYIYLDKTEENNVIIDEIKLENFTINKMPQKGNVKLLRPTGDLPNLYTYSEENCLDSGVTFKGATIDDMKNLEIAYSGGVLGFRLALGDLGNFISNDKEEIIYDGRLLTDLGVNLEEVKFSVSFDIIITTSENVNFKGTIKIDLPEDKIIEEGTSNKEITNFENVVFKRV